MEAETSAEGDDAAVTAETSEEQGVDVAATGETSEEEVASEVEAEESLLPQVPKPDWQPEPQ